MSAELLHRLAGHRDGEDVGDDLAPTVHEVAPAVLDDQLAAALLRPGLLQELQRAAVVELPDHRVLRERRLVGERRAGHVLAHPGGVRDEARRGQRGEERVGVGGALDSHVAHPGDAGTGVQVAQVVEPSSRSSRSPATRATTTGRSSRRASASSAWSATARRRSSTTPAGSSSACSRRSAAVAPVARRAISSGSGGSATRSSRLVIRSPHNSAENRSAISAGSPTSNP